MLKNKKKNLKRWYRGEKKHKGAQGCDIEFRVRKCIPCGKTFESEVSLRF